MNYKEECKEYFDNSDTNISRLEHRAKEAHKRHVSLCEEMDKNGEEWFYFEYVEKDSCGMPPRSFVR